MMTAGNVQVDPLPSVPVHIYSSSSPRPAHKNGDLESLNYARSASFTSIPGIDESAQGIKRTFSDNTLSSHTHTLTNTPAKISNAIQNANVEMFRRASQKTKKRMSAARFVSPNEAEESERAGRSTDKADSVSVKSTGRGVGALKMFSRKTWMATSTSTSTPTSTSPPKKESLENSPRQPSPTKTNGLTVPQPVATRTSPRSSQSSENSSKRSFRHLSKPRKSSTSPTPAVNTSAKDPPDSEGDAGSTRQSRRSSLSSLRSRASMDWMFLTVPSAKVPPIPASVSPDRASNQSADSSRPRDPHWIAFRSIDGEYASFQSRASLQKAKVVRTALLPFLSKTRDPELTSVLRAEDLDRRVVILNKWWSGLLELLNGTGQQSISGTDRPAFLEAICELMFRPEWKTPPFQSDNADTADIQGQSSKAESTSSVDTDDADFLVRTIHQNIRNMFVQNLIQQITFVVEKLSMRAAPASLVIFGGKTCAYAFFYCPGVAEMLTRLWHIPPGTLRRIFAEYGPDSGRRAGAISLDLATSFPPALRSLCFASYTALSRQLQNKAQPPANTGHIRWFGPWVTRWTGRDSDLFFVFVKYYHLLVAEHLNRSLKPAQRLGVPGLVVVHAQILLNLESALYRQAGHFAAEHYAAAGDNPDSMAPLPMVIPNATRSIGENRLVILLRDSIADQRPENAAMADLLFGSFQYILKAAVRKVSMYNHDACFVLCDFLEELVPLVANHQQQSDEDEDWGFWFKVYQQLMQSESTMTQIRVIAFLYSTWPILVCNDERKLQVVLGWLLQPRFFMQYFNHWSPMVRHYFCRLLCWRVGRSDGPATEVDIEIYKRLSLLLTISWAHHQYLVADAEMRETSPPSSNACAPAPGRALLIIRVDGHNRLESFDSFDKLMPSTGNQSSPYNYHCSALNKVPEADSQQSVSKKRWSILKSINLFSGPTNARPGEVTPPSSPDPTSGNSKNRLNSAGAKGQEALSRPATPPQLAVSFRFSLEYTNSRPQLPSKARKLPLPTIPHTSQKLLDDLKRLENHVSSSTLPIKEPKPVKPKPSEFSTARYSGRALSEWAQVVQECRSFYARRKTEGCTKDSAVETPHIAVESFRMFG